MRPKIYHIALVPEQREELTRKSTSQRQSVRERARVLLFADEAQAGDAIADADIASQIKVCLPRLLKLASEPRAYDVDLEYDIDLEAVTSNPFAFIFWRSGDCY